MSTRKNIEVGKLYTYTTDSNMKIVCICVQTNVEKVFIISGNRIKTYFNVFFESNSNKKFTLFQNHSRLEEIK
jgi:hypothetical protein